MQGFVDVLPDLLVLEAVEEEDENALEAVQDGEDVGHGHGRLVQVEQAKCPRQTQEEHQDEWSTDPDPVRRKSKKRWVTLRKRDEESHFSIPGVSQTGLLFTLHDSWRGLMAVHDPNSQSQEDEIGLLKKKREKETFIVWSNWDGINGKRETYGEDENDWSDKAKDKVIVSSEPAVIQCAVAEGIDDWGDGHDEDGHSVAAEVIPLDARFVRLEDLDQHDVQLESLQEHPHEGAEEEKVEEAGDEAADDPVVSRVDARQEDDLGQQ